MYRLFHTHAAAALRTKAAHSGEGFALLRRYRWLWLLPVCLGAAAAAQLPGPECLGWTDLSEFRCSTNAQREVILISPRIHPRVEWTELVVSWNVTLPAGGYLRVEACPFGPDGERHAYVMGTWSTDSATHPRSSLNGQRDAFARVDTDVLRLNEPGGDLELQLTAGPAPLSVAPELRLLTVSLNGTRPTQDRRPAVTTAWGKPLDVPTLFQLDYPGGDAWCSPTAVAMVLDYWANRTGRAELARPVPELADAVYDPEWPGTGNWSFNVAAAGSRPGIRAYVARLADLQDLELWLEHEIPLVASVTYSVLQGKPDQKDGHLVVCTGFTDAGEVCLNDPGSRQHNRRVVSRDRFDAAWRGSHRTVYVIHPEVARTPPSWDRRWLSPEAPMP